MNLVLSLSLGSQRAGVVDTTPAAPVIQSVTISPSPLRVGDTASVSVSWTGFPRTGVTYQWQRNAVNISGATGQTYVVQAGDLGTTVTCVVNINNGVGTASATGSGGVVQAALAAPVFTVTPTDSLSGRTVTVTAGTVTGNPTPTRTIAATLDGSPVTMSGTGPWTYAVPSSTVNQTLAWVVTATNSVGSTEVSGSEVIPFDLAAPSAPVFTVETTSSISGRTVTMTTGTASGNPAPTYSIAVTLDGSPVTPTGSGPWTYVVPSSASAQTLAWTVTATNSEGSDTSVANRVVAADLTAPVISGVPTISGTATVGQTLTATAASVTGNPVPTRTWQWFRSPSTAISGATNSTYTIQAADEGFTLFVRQTETNSVGTASADSAATATVGAGGGTLWTPADLPAGSLSAWYDASDASTITLNGSTVSAWANKVAGGPNVTQPTASQQPTYTANGLNGLNVLTLDGNDFFAFASNITNYRGAALVYSHTDARDWSTFMGGLANNGAGPFHGDSTAPRHVFHPSFTAVETRSGTNRHNGTSIGDGASTVRPATPVVAIHVTTAATPARPLTHLGADNFNPSARAITGIIAEVLIPNVAWDQATYEIVEGYLAWKWGLQANLPAGHPYKSAAPTV